LQGRKTAAGTVISPFPPAGGAAQGPRPRSTAPMLVTLAARPGRPAGPGIVPGGTGGDARSRQAEVHRWPAGFHCPGQACSALRAAGPASWVHRGGPGPARRPGKGDQRPREPGLSPLPGNRV